MDRQASTCKKEIGRLLSKAGFNNKYHDEIIEFVIEGPTPSLMMAALSLEMSIDQVEDEPKKRFANIVHKRNECVGKKVRWRKIIGKVVDVTVMSDEEVGRAKKKGKYDPQAPYKYLVSLRRGGKDEIVPILPGVDSFEFIVDTKKALV
jgi:hypothetical protein